MDPDFWRERWQARQIGFNMPKPHEYLVNFGAPLWQAPGASVLVPLCGKSVDMAYLAQQGASVSGVELVETAAQEFFQDLGVSTQIDSSGFGRVYSSTELPVRIFVGDFFDLTAEQLGPITAVYDRAALVALPPDLRERYVERLLELLAPQVKIVLVTMEYDQPSMKGPPFSVLEDEVKRLFSACQSVTSITSESALEREPRFAERGLSALRESAYLIVR